MGWLEHNWEHILAGLGAASILLHALEAGCQAAGWTKYQGIFSQVYKFLQGFLGNIKPPSVPPAGPAVTVLLLCLLASPVMAQTVSVGDVLNKAGAREGILYDFKAQRGLNFLAATVYEKQGFSLLAGLVSTDGIGVAVDYDIGPALPKVQVPVLGIINSLRVGIGGYVRTLTFLSDSTQTRKDDNKMGFGPSIFVKWNF